MEKVSSSLALALRGEAGKDSFDPNLWVATAVDEYLSGRTFRSDPGWFHPSSFFNKCDAKLMWAFLGIEPKGVQEPRTQRIFDAGHGRDAFWKGYLRDSGLSLIIGDDERKCVIPELRIRGELDDIIRHPILERSAVFEFKTMNSSQFKALNGPLEYHVVQAHCYMVAKRIWDSVICYECKDCQETKMFNAPFDAELWRIKVVERIQRILALIKARQTAERTPQIPDRDCQFYWMCYQTELAQLI